jgi:3-methyladenine DNA glycosylase Tag
VAHYGDDEMRALYRNEALIRHRGKLDAVRENARALLALAEEAGSMGAWLAGWPSDDVVDLWTALKSRFTQLGGQSGPRFLRMAGKDTFLMTDHVAAALDYWGAYSGRISGKRALRTVQDLFNGWMDETDLPLCQLSQTLAMSVDA